jgi:hypothetical protein
VIAAREHPAPSEVRFSVGGLDVTAFMSISLLTKVEPELPPEPPVGSVVRCGLLTYERVQGTNDDYDQEFDAWLVPGGEVPSTWEMVCKNALPVLLVPDPAAGAKSSGDWRDADEGEDATLRIGWLPDGKVGVYVLNALRVIQGDVVLSREDAEAAGRTLLAASRAD